MEQTKKPALLAVGRVLAQARTPYALIGGLALQVHQSEPRTTLDIDLAVLSRGAIPQAELEAAGFSRTGQFEHSENWIGPEGTPVQFTDDPALAPAVARAEEVEIEGVRLRVIRRADLLHEKLRAASDPARRRSKRLQDFADAQALIEDDPELAAGLTAEERAALARLPT
jgi:predicted nucleotidyltransferase